MRRPRALPGSMRQVQAHMWTMRWDTISLRTPWRESEPASPHSAATTPGIILDGVRAVKSARCQEQRKPWLVVSQGPFAARLRDLPAGSPSRGTDRVAREVLERGAHFLAGQIHLRSGDLGPDLLDRVVPVDDVGAQRGGRNVSAIHGERHGTAEVVERGRRDLELARRARVALDPEGDGRVAAHRVRRNVHTPASVRERPAQAAYQVEDAYDQLEEAADQVTDEAIGL